MLSVKDLAWAAGFIEGEGSFGHATTPCVRASQVQREPLERLQKMFGGNILLRVRTGKEAHCSPIYSWYIYGQRAAEVIMTLMCMLSPRRTEQAMESLDLWKKSTGRVYARKTHCKRGHEFTLENTRTTSSGRECKVCRAAYHRSYYLKSKGDSNWQPDDTV